MGKPKAFAIALAISVVSLLSDWLLVIPMKQWWMELGVQLPGLTISWLGPTWHLVSALVVIGTALLMRIDGFQRKGFWCWLCGLLRLARADGVGAGHADDQVGEFARAVILTDKRDRRISRHSGHRQPPTGAAQRQPGASSPGIRS